MKNYALQKIQDMPLYSPPMESRRTFDGLLLDFNEKTIAQDNLKTNIYPDYGDLDQRIAEYAGVNSDQVLATNGSDQGIDLVFRTFTQDGDKVIIPSPSFAIFYQAAMLAGNQICKPEYKENGDFPFENVLEEIDNETKLVVVCNPNNPTGAFVEIEKIEQIVQKAEKAIVFVDEAYFEYSQETAVSLMQKYPNVIISRTFSKGFGIPALRIGYLLASADHINEMLKVRGPYAVNQTACDAALQALDKIEDMEKYRDEVIKQAKPLVEDFFRKKGIKFYPSRTNFILFEINDSSLVSEKLKQEGILTRPLQDKLRVTIGTKKQMERFVEIMDKIIK